MINGNDLFINYDSIINDYFLGNDKDGNEKILKSKIINHFNNICNILISVFYSDFDSNNKFIFLESVERKKILFIVDIIQRELIKLKYNVNSKMWLDSLYSKIIGGNYD